MFDLLDRIRKTYSRRPAARARKNRAYLDIESLEQRDVPTVAFTPHFSGVTEVAPNSKTTIQQAHSQSLRSPKVVFIFTGKYWTTTQGQKDEATLSDSMKSILSGPYLSGLQQYGSDGQAKYFATWLDTGSTPTLTGGTAPNQSGLSSFVTKEINNHKGALPPGTGQNAPLYIVVNDPADSGTVAGTYGYNGPLSTGHAAYVGLKFLSSSPGVMNKDAFTQVFSHELAESMAAYVTVTDPGKFNTGSQIADNEPETGNGYTYRLSDGNLVQAYWSQNDKAFIVPDGNRQTFALTPIWSGNTFTGNYNLQVNGDQLGTNFKDDITIDRSPNTSGTRVTMNGESASFALGTIKQLNVNTAGGLNTVHVKGVESGETVSVDSASPSSFDHVIVGDKGSLSGIQGQVNVANSSGRSFLQIDASADGAQTITVTNRSVAFSKGPVIGYTGAVSNPAHGVMGLEIDDAPRVVNQIDAVSVSPLTPVSVEHDSLRGGFKDHVFGPAAGQVAVQG
jgi:hypothetical protein